MIDYLLYKSRRFVRNVFYYLTLPIRQLVAFVEGTIQFLIGWWFRRDFRFLLWGVPALLAVIGSTYVVLSAYARVPVTRADQYLSAGRAALASGKWSAARLYLERAWELNPNNNEVLFQLATAASGEGDESRVNAVMGRLAPDDRAVYGPAHQVKALSLLQQRAGDPEAIRLADQQLDYALSLDANNLVAHRLRGSLYFDRGMMAQAIYHFEKIVERDPDVTLMLAKAYLLTGGRTQAEYWGRLGQRHFANLTAATPNKVEVRLAWAEACMFLENFQQATEVLAEGRKFDDDPRLSAALARVWAMWSDALLTAEGNTQQQRFQLLTQAVLLNPSDMFLFDRMMSLLREAGTQAEAREFLLKTMASGQAVGMCHLLLGTYAFENSQASEAVFHLERAFQDLPAAPVVANNYAWLLLHHDPRDPERALKIMDAVVKKFPDPRFVDTRGHAYLQLERWDDAVRDLESALAATREEPGTHRALAKAYAALGQHDLAQRSQMLADELTGKESGGAPSIP